MPLVVAVSFRDAGKRYLFDPGPLDLRPGDWVVAESSRGLELGVVKSEPREAPAEELTQPLRPIVRLATPEDHEQARLNRDKEQEALGVCAAKIAKHGLPMKLLRAEYTLDRARIVFFFFAEGRVDFRELVKDLAAALRTRIELHQVGARDAAKLLGGYGRCGRELCCVTWLGGFDPVSMKMAKDQDLALNPTKFSGQCGKLTCCLRYEVEHYREARRSLPRVGTMVHTQCGPAKVVEVNVPGEFVRVEYPETGVRISLPASQLAAPLAQEDCPRADQCGGCGAASSLQASQPPDGTPAQ